MDTDVDVNDDVDSLFGSDSDQDVVNADEVQLLDGGPVASRTAPNIFGMFFFPNLISRELHDRVLHQVSACGYFALQDGSDIASSEDAAYRRSPRNQAMMFARSLASPASTIASGSAEQVSNPSSEESPSGCSGLPSWAIDLIQHLRELLTSQPDHHFPLRVKQQLFPQDQLLSRQLILNLYNGAEGLAPHVDFVNRFADGIVLCSFGPYGTGTVMDFTHAVHPAQHLFLPSGSVLVLSGEARYDWKHGISARDVDHVQAEDGSDRVDALKRSIRLSVTIRSMLPGADVVGE
ncbi:uncharacterized protein SPSC_02251 [Sporisorium scitamineum]|uniref:Fe2OG dioxygenase domain-containing protein n=1 Tax=Sporisorium scitamineum TaxID=49012 RepID=A0A0F7S595_9BASI|nr:uncharacterized protein SPSC_02251 [Sporisorium scitamineum]CDW95787.1 hypothetical protein [Sporisorium scitamineum]